jgi:hypothetical protein
LPHIATQLQMPEFASISSNGNTGLSLCWQRPLSLVDEAQRRTSPEYLYCRRSGGDRNSAKVQRPGLLPVRQ